MVGAPPRSGVYALAACCRGPSRPAYTCLCSTRARARAADGDEGGRHQLISATVGQGKLWVLKIQIGDKRWFKGVNKEALGSFDSFTVL